MVDLRISVNDSSDIYYDEVIVDVNINAEFINIHISNIYEVADLFRTNTKTDWIELSRPICKFNYIEFYEAIRYGCSVMNCEMPPEKEVGKLYLKILRQLTTRKVS